MTWQSGVGIVGLAFMLTAFVSKSGGTDVGRLLAGALKETLLHCDA